MSLSDLWRLTCEAEGTPCQLSIAAAYSKLSALVTLRSHGDAPSIYSIAEHSSTIDAQAGWLPLTEHFTRHAYRQHRQKPTVYCSAMPSRAPGSTHARPQDRGRPRSETRPVHVRILERRPRDFSRMARPLGIAVVLVLSSVSSRVTELGCGRHSNHVIAKLRSSKQVHRREGLRCIAWREQKESKIRFSRPARPRNGAGFDARSHSHDHKAAVPLACSEMRAGGGFWRGRRG